MGKVSNVKNTLPRPSFPSRPSSFFDPTVASSIACQLLEHLPHSVNGVGEELARGDLDLEPFYAIAKVVPSELLGYVVVVRVCACTHSSCRGPCKERNGLKHL